MMAGNTLPSVVLFWFLLWRKPFVKIDTTTAGSESGAVGLRLEICKPQQDESGPRKAAR